MNDEPQNSNAGWPTAPHNQNGIDAPSASGQYGTHPQYGNSPQYVALQQNWYDGSRDQVNRAERNSLILSVIAVLFLQILGPWSWVVANRAARMGADTTIAKVLSIIATVMLCFGFIAFVFLFVVLVLSGQTTYWSSY